MNLFTVHEYRFEGASDRVRGSLLSCLRLPNPGVTFQYQIEKVGKSDLAISLSDTRYGSLGKIVIKDQPNTETLISFTEPGYPDGSEAAEYLPQLLQSQPNLPAGVRLALILDQTEKVTEQMRPLLHQVRLQLHIEVKKWLFGRLKIFGFRNLISQISSNPDPETFHFPIQAKPAQAAALARRIAREWEEKGSPVPGCLVQDPETCYAVGNVLPDSGPLNVILNKKNASLKCLIHSTSLAHSQMNVILADREDNWRLWDILRDEMERAGYIQISDPAQVERKEEETAPTVLERPDLEGVPDKGDHQQILHLWHAGKTAKEIARQTGRTEKTILNLLAVWRKEYGEATVPRRR